MAAPSPWIPTDEKFRALLEAAPDAMVIVNEEGTIVLVNAQSERLFGYQRDEMVGRTVDLLVPERYGPAHKRHRATYFGNAHPRPMGAELALFARRKDASEFPVEISLSPLVTEHGTLAIAAVRDISARKRAEAQFRALLESAPDAMVIVDGAGEIVLVNRASEALFGRSRHELVGHHVERLFPDRLRNQQIRRIFGGEAGADARSWATELSALRSDGTEFPVEISLGRLQTSRGPLVSAAVRDITDRKEAEARLAHQAVHDALTGLPNRTLLVDRLRQVLARRGRIGSHAAVLFVDLDRFKLLNDSRGHALGDGVLVAVAERLRRCTRPGDTVARFGGDEFVVVCEDLAEANEATLLGQRIAASFDRPFPVAGGEVFLTVSVGIALAAPGVTAEGLLRDADAAMYRAKERGRARLELFDAGMRTEAAARLTMGSALHRALERDELLVRYQPVVELATGAVVGVEALLRWSHPELGPVAPAVFVPMAEEAGLILSIGDFVLEEALGQWARWRTAHPGRPPLQLAINLSGRQLHEPSLVETIRDALRRHRIDPACVCFELTESVLIDDLHLRAPSVLALKQLGVSLAIDDFGTGYSSLTYLKSLPVDILKIDQSFVAGLGQNLSDQAIVRTVVELAHALGLRVVGEGAENDAQADELRRLGCELAQGFLFGRPVGPEAIDELLGRGPNLLLPDTAAAV